MGGAAFGGPAGHGWVGHRRGPRQGRLGRSHQRARGGAARLRPARLGRARHARHRQLQDRRHRGDAAAAGDARCNGAVRSSASAAAERCDAWPRRPSCPSRPSPPRVRRERRWAGRWASWPASWSGPVCSSSKRLRSSVPSSSAREMAARCAPGVATADNPAKQLAWSLVDRFVMISGSGFLAPVARRWKTQLNENSKAAAVFEELPEATHNTVVGFEQPDSLRDHLGRGLSCAASWTIRATRCGPSSWATSWTPGRSGTPPWRRPARGGWAMPSAPSSSATTSASTWPSCTRSTRPPSPSSTTSRSSSALADQAAPE